MIAVAPRIGALPVHALRRPAGRDRALAAAFALSVLLHVGLLVRGGSGGPANHAIPSTLLVRMIMAAPAALPPPVPLTTAPAAREPSVRIAPAESVPTQRSTETPVESKPKRPEPIATPAREPLATRGAPAAPEPLPQSQPQPQPQPQPSERAAPPDATTPPAASTSPYRSGVGLDVRPSPLDDIVPEYPVEAGTRGGTVVLRLFIDELGVVDRVEVVRAAPPGLFDAAAVRAFGAARFSPGYAAGIPVKSQVVYEVEFEPGVRSSPASGKTY